MKRESQALKSYRAGRESEEERPERQRGPQNRILQTGIVMVIVAVLCLQAERAEALYCGKRLVAVGASKAEVLHQCGEPEARDWWVEYRSVVQPLAFAPLEEALYIPVLIEEWEYNFGERRFRQRLQFENGRLREIEALGYGD